MTMTTAERGALGQDTIETRASWLVASTAVGIAFPPAEASSRVPVQPLFFQSGMATGSWLTGAI
jgi:hypothetical protein